MKKHQLLTRRDILNFEEDVCNALLPLLGSENASLYFPSLHAVQPLDYIEEEDKILIPLSFKDSEELLAVLLARSPSKEKIVQILPILPDIVHFILEKIQYKKALRYDANIELFTQDVLLTNLAEKIEEMRQQFTEISEFSRNNFLTLGCAGVVYLHCADLHMYAKKYGYLFAEQCLNDITQHFLEQLPDNCILARVNSYDCAFFIEDEMLDSRNALNDFVYNLCLSASAITFTLPRNHQKSNNLVSTSVHAGYLVFPQDFDAIVSESNSQELAHAILAKAHYSAQRAKEQKKILLPFSFLIAEGGNIVKSLPHNQCIINLGKSAGMREGAHFSVYTMKHTDFNGYAESQKIYKGELRVMEVFEDFSRAEQTFLYDPAYPLQENDTLIQLPDDYSHNTKSTKNLQKDALTQLYSYADFLLLFAELKQENPQFTLSLIYVEDTEHADFMNTLAQIVQLFQNNICAAQDFSERKCVLSKYGRNGILVFLPLSDEFGIEETYASYAEFAKLLMKHIGQEIAIGIAEYPLLNYSHSETIDNAKKAMECAKLLPYPHVSMCDSTALTVSADKFATQGLLFEAVQEYQNAILADKNNALAYNAMGVALVNLKRYGEAQKAFLNALELTPDDVSLHYNLGGIFQKLNDSIEARKYYSQCLQSDEYAYFAHLRLGHIAEDEEESELAKNHYSQALAINDTDGQAYRQLAKIALDEQNYSLARELLHNALRYSPNDGKSRLLLAKLYLENNEDPSLAAVLLAPIMNAKQHNPDIWRLYIKALRQQGKIDEAERAENTLKNIQE